MKLMVLKVQTFINGITIREFSITQVIDENYNKYWQCSLTNDDN